MENIKAKIYDILFKKQIIGCQKFFSYVIFLSLSFTAFIVGFSFINFNDGFWHIKVGEYIISTGTVPHYDIFSWYGISMHLKWIPHEWLFGIIAYLVFCVQGFKSVSLFIGLVNVTTIILLYIFVKTRSNNNWVALFCISLYVLFSYKEYAIAFRPLTISALIIILMCILLEKKRYKLSLILVIIGVNVHGGIYPVYLILFAYYTLFKNYKYFIAAVVSVLIGPNTYNTYLYTIKNLQEMKYESASITEWAPVTLYNNKVSLIIVIIIIMVFALSKPKFKDILFSLPFVVLSISAKRQLIFLSIIVVPMISPYIEEAVSQFLCDSFYKLKLYKNINKLFNIDKDVFIKGMIIAIIEFSFVMINSQYCYDFFHNGMQTFKVNPSNNPVYAADYINKHAEIKNSHLLSHYNDSQYLIFRGIPTFVDSRADLFMPSYNENTEVFYDDMLGLVFNYKPENLIKKYKINYILINKSYSVYNTFNTMKNLKIIYDDKNYCIFKVVS